MKLEDISPMLLHDWKDSDPLNPVAQFLGNEKYGRSEFNSDIQWHTAVIVAATKKIVEPITDFRVLFGSYTYEDYAGNAFLLLAINGQLHENNGSHCSCNDLEDQWDPEVVTVKQLRYRMEDGALGDRSDGPFAAELELMLQLIEKCK